MMAIRRPFERAAARMVVDHLRMAVEITVREIEPGDIHSGVDQLFHDRTAIPTPVRWWRQFLFSGRQASRRAFSFPGDIRLQLSAYSRTRPCRHEPRRYLSLSRGKGRTTFWCDPGHRRDPSEGRRFDPPYWRVHLTAWFPGGATLFQLCIRWSWFLMKLHTEILVYPVVIIEEKINEYDFKSQHLRGGWSFADTRKTLEFYTKVKYAVKTSQHIFSS